MLEGLVPTVQVRACGVRRILADLDDADRAVLESAMESPQVWPVKTLSRALSQRGLKLSETPIRSHRNRECSCFNG